MRNKLKVALVHDYFMQYGGAERVFEAIFELFPNADIFCPVVDHNILKKLNPPVKGINTSRFFSQRFVKKHYRAFLSFYPLVVEKFDFSKYDLVISDSSAWVKNIITPPDTVHISYIYNPMRFAWNFFHKDIKARSWLERVVLIPITHFLRLWDQVSTNRIDSIISISQHVRKRIKKYLNRDSMVIYPYVDWDFFKPSNYKGNYFLLVSRMRAYKKIDLAIKAFNYTQDKLVIIGGGEMLPLYKRMAKKNIVFIDSVDDDHLREYYAHCRAFIFPQEEDFGITPLEAQSCGRPVIAYGKGGALETIKENETGIFFKKQTVNSLISAIEKFKKIEKSFDKGKIRTWAKKFSKENFQKQFSEAVAEIVKEKWNNHGAPEHNQVKENKEREKWNNHGAPEHNEIENAKEKEYNNHRYIENTDNKNLGEK